MPIWKSLLLNLYYHASLPVRWWNDHCLRAEDRAPLMVLYFHRIADDDATPWTISNTLFARQIHWLQRHFELISLEETQRRIRSGANDRPAVSITFDDGYSENCRHAIPLLVRERIPCTYFVTAGNVLEGRPFKHDLLYGLNLDPNSLDQLKAMAAAGIDIGAHTYNHVDLGTTIDRHELFSEVVLAADELRAAIGHPVRYFAFPYGLHGNLSREAFRLGAEAGYEAMCSAYGGFNYPGDDPFHLQRIPVDSTMIRLKNWVTGDPRKLRTKRWVYQTTSFSPGTCAGIPTPVCRD